MSGGDEIAVAVAWYAAFIFSASCHEAGHALAALKLGDATAYLGGQVSLNPAPHIRREPIGMVVVPLISLVVNGWPLGWASAALDPFWAARYPKRAALMALAGPASNLLLVLAAAILIRVGLHVGWFFPPDSVYEGFDVTMAAQAGLPRAGATLLSVFFTLNLVLLVFNLIPLAPLDGAWALPLVMGARRAERYQAFFASPQRMMLGLVIAFVVFRYVFGPIRLAALNVLYLGVGSYY